MAHADGTSASTAWSFYLDIPSSGALWADCTPSRAATVNAAAATPCTTGRLTHAVVDARLAPSDGRWLSPSDAALSRGLEVHPWGAGDELEIWIDRRYVPAGYGWSFPAGDELRIGVGSFDPRFHVKDTTVQLAEDLEREPVRYQGNWIPHRLRAATEDGVFFVGNRRANASVTARHSTELYSARLRAGGGCAVVDGQATIVGVERSEISASHVEVRAMWPRSERCRVPQTAAGRRARGMRTRSRRGLRHNWRSRHGVRGVAPGRGRARYERGLGTYNASQAASGVVGWAGSGRAGGASAIAFPQARVGIGPLAGGHLSCSRPKRIVAAKHQRRRSRWTGGVATPAADR